MEGVVSPCGAPTRPATHARDLADVPVVLAARMQTCRHSYDISLHLELFDVRDGHARLLGSSLTTSRSRPLKLCARRMRMQWWSQETGKSLLMGDLKDRHNSVLGFPCSAHACHGTSSERVEKFL